MWRQLPANLPSCESTFATNPDIPDDQCNPLVRYELDADLSQLSIQATIETDGQTHIRNIVLKSAEGRLTATESVSGFSPDEASCSQVALKLIDIKCGDPETFMLSACPDADNRRRDGDVRQL